jgi:hypothetical protein
MKPILKLIFVSIICFQISLPLSAQQKFKCAAGGDVEENVLQISAIELANLGSEEDNYYLNVLSKKISTELLGLPQTQPIKLLPASNVNNFQAESDPSAYIIYYNPTFVNNLKSITGISNWVSIKSASKPSSQEMKNQQGKLISDYSEGGMSFFRDNKFTWIITGILVHEMSHIVRGHNVILGKKPHERELEADELTGEILKRLQANEQDAIRWLKVLPQSETESHPAREKREAAVIRGWSDLDKTASVIFGDFSVEHNVNNKEGKNGMAFYIDFTVKNMKSSKIKLTAWLHDENQTSLKDLSNTAYKTSTNSVATSEDKDGNKAISTVLYNVSKFTKYDLFIPYSELGISMEGSKKLHIKFGVFNPWWDEDISTSGYYPFSFTFK